MTTTENNRADALIDERIEDAIYRHIPPKIALENAKALYAMAVELLVASPVEQPAAAPADERAALPQIPDLVKATAWLTMCLRTELSRLDDDTHKALDEVEAQLSCVRAITNGAIDYEVGAGALRQNVATVGNVILAIRNALNLAASANETGAEGATWYDRWQAECTRDHGEYDENAPIADRLRWWVPKSARHGTILLEDDLREAADELSRFPAMSAAAPADGACKHCGSTTAQACNDVGCFYLESGDGEPSAAPADERAVSFEAWCDRFPEISAVERLRDAWQESRATLPEDRIDWITNTHCPGGTAYPVNVKNAIREALREARISDNETGAEVAQQLSAEIAELKIKLVSYEREREDQIRYLAAQSEEIAGLKQQLAHADARVGLTATVIQKCIDSCAAEYLEDVTGHPEDAAYCQGITDCIDALNRLKTADWSAILAAHSGQSEPETATVACIERLRKALFESRDAMRVMSNWAKKPDPAGHSWAVRMLDRANAALNGEPEPRSELTVSRCFRCGHADHAGPCVNVHPDLAARAGDAENDYARFRSIAEDLKEGGNHVASEAIDELLTSAISAHDAKQEAARHAKRITELEAALEMVRGIRYQEMRLHLPEGGHVSLRWPESMSLESAEMLREVFDLQMKAHAKYMANRVTAPEADAARTGASS